MDNLEERMDRIEHKLDALLTLLRSGGGAPRNAGGNGAGTQGAGSHGGGGDSEGAIDADLDGPRGDPEVRFVPKRWTGPDCKGRRFSQCEPEFLDLLADAYEWFARRDDETGALDKNGAPKSRWSRLDAARARGWASRLRGGSGHASGPSSNVRNQERANASPRRNGGPPPPRAPRDLDAHGGGPELDDDIPF